MGQLCIIGSLDGSETRLFYYRPSPTLMIELMDRRKRGQKHLLALVDAKGNPIPLPKGSYFKHISTSEEQNLLENHIRSHEYKDQTEG